MKKFSDFHIKTHLSQILKDITKSGESIAITQHGRTTVLLTPVPSKNSIRSAIESIRKNRKGVNLGKDLSLRPLMKEGRR